MMKKICKNCKYFIRIGRSIVFSMGGNAYPIELCCRYPTNVEKEEDEFCGEFKVKK